MCISPTLEIDGETLADASVEDVGRLLEKRGIGHLKEAGAPRHFSNQKRWAIASNRLRQTD
jgi:hypothetical protein